MSHSLNILRSASIKDGEWSNASSIRTGRRRSVAIVRFFDFLYRIDNQLTSFLQWNRTSRAIAETNNQGSVRVKFSNTYKLTLPFQVCTFRSPLTLSTRADYTRRRL